MVRGIKPKEGCKVIPPAGRENIQYIERRHMCMVSSSRRYRVTSPLRRETRLVLRDVHAVH
jgi:hypothetical protein